MINPLVDFLASYGPQPSSNNLYDEFVQKAAERTGCAPLTVDQPLVEELAASFRGPTPVSVILTGTAGDGKTYTARKLLSALAPDAAWENTDKEFAIELTSGRRLRFIKDLSELNEADKDAILPDVLASLDGRGDDLFVICVNDGHLLKFFRDREKSEGCAQLLGKIAIMLRDDQRNGGGFQLINMSRQSHAQLVDAILDAIVNHPGWANCAGCPVLTSEEHRCPIQCNLEVLRPKGGDAMRARLRDMISMAAADGRHLSIRQLILLSVNILLGDKAQGKALLTCAKAKNRANKREYDKTSPFSNAFGDNLSQRERSQYGAFTVLSEFEVGFETNNFFDHLLLFPGESDLEDHAWYGTSIFKTHLDGYRHDPGTNVTAFRREMADQRRRLFFSIDPASDQVRGESRRDPWNLSVFKNGAAYVALVEGLKSGSGMPPPDIRLALFRGLNRMMTGELTTTDDRLWLTEPSGVFLGRDASLLIAHAGRKSVTPTYVTFSQTIGDGRPPVLRIVLGGKEDLHVDLALRPTIFECLMRVAGGALPASFSAECQQDVERFQLRAAAAVRLAMAPQQPAPEQIEMGRDGKLQNKPIELMVADAGGW